MTSDAGSDRAIPSADSVAVGDTGPVSDGAAPSMDATSQSDVLTPQPDVASLPDASVGMDASVVMDASRDAAADARADARADASVPADAGPSSSRHTARPLGTTMAGNGFWEYLPPGYSSTGARAPLLVFWHGIGENGNGSMGELSRVLSQGPPRLINGNRWPADRPFVVLSPQHAGGGCPTANEIRDFFTFAQANYNVDPRRIYLTGLSCGAIGSWNYLGAHVDTSPVAAAVLICGDGNGAWGAQRCDLGRVALWGFHGDADGTVAPSGTINPMQNLMNMCPSPPRRDARLTVYPGVGHDSWSRTYDLSAGHDVYAWLLANGRP
jgi:poly(3-hydroxybutyrate) depolymerase